MSITTRALIEGTSNYGFAIRGPRVRAADTKEIDAGALTKAARSLAIRREIPRTLAAAKSMTNGHIKKRLTCWAESCAQQVPQLKKSEKISSRTLSF